MTKQIHLRLMPSYPVEGGGLMGNAGALKIAETVLLLKPRRSLTLHCPHKRRGLKRLALYQSQEKPNARDLEHLRVTQH